MKTYQLSLHNLGVDIGVFRRLSDLQSDLDERARKVANGDELAQRRNQNGLELSLGGA